MTTTFRFLDDPARWRMGADTNFGPLLRAQAEVARATATGAWSRAARALSSISDEARRGGPDLYDALVWSTQIEPWRAYALARAGQVAEAERAVAATPIDCYQCLRSRGLIALARGDRKAAEDWFARAAAEGPELPFAYLDQASAALAAGDATRALSLAQTARRLGPRWADAAFLAGQARVKLGRCRAAQQDLAMAQRLAPAWDLPRRAMPRCA